MGAMRRVTTVALLCAVQLLIVVVHSLDNSDSSDESGSGQGRQLYSGIRKDFVHERGMYEGGDMVIPKEQQDLLRADELFKSGIIGQRYRWPGGRIYYQLDNYFNNRERNLILRAMEEFHAKTCIRFYPRERNTASWVYIKRGGSGCWSYVGKQGGGQVLTLQAPYCLNKGTIIHELMHSVGFFHEQSRPDRDSYVSVNWRNIAPGQRYNFAKYGRNYVETQGLGYDYKSIMHYSGYAFAMNPWKPTLYPLKSGIKPGELGQYKGLTDLDVQKINRMYRGICSLKQ